MATEIKITRLVDVDFQVSTREEFEALAADEALVFVYKSSPVGDRTKGSSWRYCILYDRFIVGYSE